MTETSRATLDAEKAQQIWAEYERTHDLRGQERLAVGIDPDTGEVHFGKSLEDIGERLEREGRFKPLYYRWVNDPNYYHRGGRR
jgi:hypothetical protein